MSQGQNEAINRMKMKIENAFKQQNLEYTLADNGAYSVTHGSSAAFVYPYVSGNVSIIKIQCFVASDIKRITNELLLHLNNLNFKSHMGKFIIDTENNGIYLEHQLFGEFSSEIGIACTTSLLAEMADQNDEVICGMTSGKRFKDL